MKIQLTKDEFYEASVACEKLKNKRIDGEYCGCNDCPLNLSCDGQMITVLITEVLPDVEKEKY